MACVCFIVTGKVQGVCFRASARDEALRLRLAGHARNLPDGSVEVLACGEDSAVEALERWIRIGPPAARVDGVRRMVADTPPPSGFRVF